MRNKTNEELRRLANERAIQTQMNAARAIVDNFNATHETGQPLTIDGQPYFPTSPARIIVAYLPVVTCAGGKLVDLRRAQPQHQHAPEDVTEPEPV